MFAGNGSFSMADVILVLLHLYGHVTDYCGNSVEAKGLVQDIERRWAAEENPLFFLAFALHPAYRQTAAKLLEVSLKLHGNWTKNRNPFCVLRVVVLCKVLLWKV